MLLSETNKMKNLNIGNKINVPQHWSEINDQKVKSSKKISSYN